jgi:hypothetical protein
MTSDQLLRNKAEAYLGKLVELFEAHRWPTGELSAVMLDKGLSLLANERGAWQAAQILHSVARDLELEAIK